MDEASHKYFPMGAFGAETRFNTDPSHSLPQLPASTCRWWTGRYAWSLMPGEKDHYSKLWRDLLGICAQGTDLIAKLQQALLISSGAYSLSTPRLVSDGSSVRTLYLSPVCVLWRGAALPEWSDPIAAGINKM